ncbi:MAG: CPBP family intramembrane metalloprotease [Gemmataceae bacterium]|nr:CPBP family intramembrane metalloprotease [Gemmataceae bacterium]
MPDGNDFRPPDESAALPPSEAPPEMIPAVLPVRPPPHPGFWWAVLWCFGILIVTQLLPSILAVVIFIAASFRDLKPEELTDAKALIRSPVYVQAMLAALLASQVTTVAMALLVIRLIVGKGWSRILAVRLPSLSHLLLAVMGLPGIMVISMGIEGLVKQVAPSVIDLDEMMAIFGAWPWPLAVLVIGLGPGIGEELWFRGFFGRGIVGRHGVVGGVLLTSLLFGAIHIEPRQAVPAMFIGVLLHLCYLASRSLLVPMILHTANNSLSVLAMHIPALAAFDMPAGQIPWYVYGSAVLLVAAVGWAFYKSQAVLIDDSSSGASPWRPPFVGVEIPPATTATRVRVPTPDAMAWLVVLASLALFVGAVAIVVKSYTPPPGRMAGPKSAAILSGPTSIGRSLL